MVFLDSNVWLYALFPQQSHAKSALAKDLIRNNRREIVLSSQVVIEVGANLLRKAKFSEAQITKFIENAYEDYVVIDVSHKILLHASQLRSRYSLAYFDSIIVSAALESGSTILYSEDMQDGLVVDKQLTITNPFTPG
jgi:predicted nucleic acid-binding protein